MLAPPIHIPAAEFATTIEALPNVEAVYAVWAGAQLAYMGKTAMLRRRLQRILSLDPRGLTTHIEYWLSGSRFESGLIHYQLAKAQQPDSYLKILKLRMPPYVRLLESNPFPRTQVTAKLGASKSLHYGPFRTRAAAEQFETQLLDLFQIRRCQEDLSPSADHPGCMYGEMNLCLRPCQAVVGREEYQGEVSRFADFLIHDGKAMLQTLSASRDRLSEEMNFEEAARIHRRMDKVTGVLALGDGLAREIDNLRGVAITSSAVPDTVRLWFLWRGCWQSPQDFVLTSHISLDRRLREMVATMQPQADLSRQDRQDHLALLARWYYSTWRDGEWLGFEAFDRIPYRKLVNAIKAVAQKVPSAPTAP